MTEAFHQLFKLDFKHKYFENATFPQIFQSEAILNNAIGLYHKNLKNGFFTFLKNFSNPNYSSKEDHPILSLYFPIRVINTNFFNFSAINYEPNKIICFSNEQANRGTILGEEGQTLDVRPSQFIYPLDLNDLKSIRAIQLIDPIDRIHSLPLPLSPYANGYPIQLKGELAGKYELHFDFAARRKKIIYAFFCSDTLFKYPTPFVFEYKINLFKYVTYSKPRSYTLLFNSRKTYWHYFLIGLEQNDWDSVKISPVEIDNKYAVFKKVKEAILLSNGQFAFQAFSTLPIPLRFRPNWKVRLTSNRIPEGVLLPFPQPANLTFPTHSRKSKQPHSDFFVSEIYSYF